MLHDEAVPALQGAGKSRPGRRSRCPGVPGDPGVPGTVGVDGPGDPGDPGVVVGVGATTTGAAPEGTVVGVAPDPEVVGVLPEPEVVGVVPEPDVVGVVPGPEVVGVAPEAVVVVAAAHTGVVIVLWSSVTAAFRASRRPTMVAPVSAVIADSARTLPIRCEPVPRVAELPTCQNTLQAVLPPSTTTLLFDAVMNVEPAWKMNTAAGSPWVSSVSVPVMPNVPDRYTPGVRVLPPSSTACAENGVAPAAVLYAVVRSVLACAVTAFPWLLAPFSVTVPNPVSVGVGSEPTSPLIVVAPVFVIPAPASTAKVLAPPRPTAACAAPLLIVGSTIPAPSAITASGVAHVTIRR